MKGSRAQPVDPIGLSREESATYIGIGSTLFDSMVADGRLPPPRELGGRIIWDREELYAAFKALPHRLIRPDTAGTSAAKSDWSRLA